MRGAGEEVSIHETNYGLTLQHLVEYPKPLLFAYCLLIFCNHVNDITHGAHYVYIH